MGHKGPIHTARFEIPEKLSATQFNKHDAPQDNGDFNFVESLGPLKFTDNTDHVKDMIKALHSRYQEALPLKNMRPPFVVRIENGRGSGNPIGICVGKYFTIRGTWLYRVLSVNNPAAAKDKRTFGGNDFDATNITAMPNSELTPELRQMLTEIKQMDSQVNKRPEDGDPVM